MPKAIFTTEAEQDLGRIVDYIAQDSVLAALSWLEEMRAVCDLIATQPGIGRCKRTALVTCVGTLLVTTSFITSRTEARSVLPV
ncbi:MAG TPA: type II toxin-antitoxin system RelE/ParE family toxin [Pirellulales bacterium]|jgi:plasmid stabilization system protein ParE|nr:type II toxin-antitoxin system RelE/ParE family toxin [Pirellulales bacterium]